MMMKEGALLCLALCLVGTRAARSAGCGRPSPVRTATTTVQTGRYGGMTRSWRLHVPASYDPDQTSPLIVSTHGWGGDGQQEERSNGLTATAARTSAIVVFPDGASDNSNRGSWGSWNVVGSTRSPGPEGPICYQGDNSYCYDSCRAQNSCDSAGCSWTTCANDVNGNGFGKEKHKIDAKTNKKAMYRLVTAAEKTKKVLSANPQAPINIECFMDDIDVKGMMDRAEMLSVAEPFLVKLDGIMAEALAASGLTQAEISNVEIFGGSCRIPAVQDRIA